MTSDTKKIRVIFSGGGTLGSVMPLVAVLQELKKRAVFDYDFLWVGIKNGPEKIMAEKNRVAFVSLPEAKLRRYFSWQNFTDVFSFVAAFFKSARLIKKWRPDILISAGGFMSVPLHLAACLLKKKTIILQEDVVVGLANKIMSRFADFIAVSLESQIKKFAAGKTIWLGNPIREEMFYGTREKAIGLFLLAPDLPIILVLGGGTGALNLNKILMDGLEKIVRVAQVIHVFGRGKDAAVPFFTGRETDSLIKERYHPVEFLDSSILADVYAAADLVVTRAGFSTLSELAVLGKPFISVPIPRTHQEQNATFFYEKAGALIFNESRGGWELANLLVENIKNKEELVLLGGRLKKIMLIDAREKFAVLVEEIVKKNKNPPA